MARDPTGRGLHPSEHLSRPGRLRAVIHVDPSKSGHLGLAAILDNHLELVAVPALHNQVGRTWHERVAPWLIAQLARAHAAGANPVIACEDPPPTMKKSSGRQGSQGVIGKALGQVIGAAELWCVQQGVPFALTNVSTWHDHRDGLMKVYDVGMPEAARAPNPFAPAKCRPMPRLEAPSSTGMTVVRWSCGTEQTVRVSRLETLSTGCPVHDVPLTDTQRQAIITDKHKACSYALAAALWPVQIAAIVERARAKAKDVQEPWRYRGVADACEAALQALTVRDRGL